MWRFECLPIGVVFFDLILRFLCWMCCRFDLPCRIWKRVLAVTPDIAFNSLRLSPTAVWRRWFVSPVVLLLNCSRGGGRCWKSGCSRTKAGGGMAFSAVGGSGRTRYRCCQRRGRGQYGNALCADGFVWRPSGGASSLARSGQTASGRAAVSGVRARRTDRTHFQRKV